jgi:hypothetical protein
MQNGNDMNESVNYHDDNVHDVALASADLCVQCTHTLHTQYILDAG